LLPFDVFKYTDRRGAPRRTARRAAEEVDGFIDAPPQARMLNPPGTE
jgi:hypothetical protein